MRKFLFPGLVGLLLLILAACGSSATAVPAAKQAPAAPAAAAQPAAPAAAAQPAAAAAKAAPAAVSAEGEKFKLQYACINRTLEPCKLVESTFIPMVRDATKGRVEIVVTSFPELGIAGTDTLGLTKDGTLPFTEIYAGYVGGEVPLLDAQYLWGTVRDGEAKEQAVQGAREYLDKVVQDATGGGTILIRNWYPSDNWFWSKKPLHKLQDYKGMKVRSHSTALSDFIKGFGAEGQFVAFTEVYTALERGILGAGITCTTCGIGLRWYEVTDYLVGPIPDRAHTWGTVNKAVWDKFPPDIQQALLKTSKEYEVINLGLRAKWEEEALKTARAQGMEIIEFSPEVRQAAWDVALNVVIPSWISRNGGATSAGGKEAIRMWNKYFAPQLGVEIAADGVAKDLGAKPAAAAVAAPPTGLAAAAAKLAGKPGAIYIGDLKQLVGPAPAKGLGDANDAVNLAGLERERYLFDSDYYRALVVKANVVNPTKLVYNGPTIEIQDVCINRTVATCKLVEAVFAKNVTERTNGKVKVTISSFPELGLAGTDTLQLVSDGTLGFAEIYPGYVAGDLPEVELPILYGLYPNHEVEFKAATAVQGDLDKLYVEHTGGGKVIFHRWISGGDQFFFCKDPITTLAQFKGKKTRSHGAAMTDWIEGMGAEALIVAFAETYTALERGILDCGVTVAFASVAQRWYEVTKYMIGPLSSQLLTNEIMNKKLWESLPPDVQQILVEEGAKHELESMRITPAWNEVFVKRNIDAGMTFLEFSPALKDHMKNVAVVKRVIPGFLKRVGGGDKPIVKVFNEKVAPIVGLRINPDGTTTAVPITK